LNQLLVEMDGFESNDGVILLAATNRPDVLDPALLRPGRFDRQVIVPNPDVKGREGILKVHASKVPLAKDVDLHVVSRGTPGFSGADLANLINEASLLAARTDKNEVEMVDMEEAKDKVMMGAERRSLVISKEEKINTAYHEAGHALVARFLPGTDPIHKVTIIPRGRALGLTQQLPVDERHTYNKDYLVNNIRVLMGGRAAEELALNNITTGAGNDIERATEMARKMVCEWGMGRMGPVSFGKKEEHIFLGREMGESRNFSEKTAIEIDDEIKEIVRDAHVEAKKIVSEHRQELEALAAALLDRESVNGTEVDEILGIETKTETKTEPEAESKNENSDD
ncbi:AAA family ATPase, partial [bacterium]|nr:AAA family ATPase [bacterium]